MTHTLPHRGLVVKASLFLIVYFVFLSFAPWASGAEESAPEGRIQAIEVQGNRIVSVESILSQMKTKIGGPFSQQVLDEDLKRLYATGFFTDIRINLERKPEGTEVAIVVQEKPVIASIRFEGSKAFSEKKLSAIMKVKVQEFLDHSRLRKDVAALTSEYQKKGYARADITYDVQMRQEQEADVSIRIREGSRVKIKKVAIEGNRAFAAKRIQKLIKTKKDTLFTSGHLKEEVLAEDVERITSFYQKEGYLDAAVTDRIEYDASGKHMVVRITIDEGSRYLVGELRLRGALLFPERELYGLLVMKQEGPFSREGLRNDIANLQKYYFDRGYINAEINADTVFDEETGRVNVNYSIIENELAYVREVRIRGNLKTRDVVIRRELRVHPGEPFDGKKLKRSRDRLFNLGFFDEVAFDTEPTNVRNQNDLVVEVREKKTGEFSFGAGFSSIDRFIGFIEVTQRNFDWRNPPTFVGSGQDLRVRGQVGASRQDYMISWTEPWIFNQPMSFGFDLYRTTRERSGTSGYSFDQRKTGGDLRLGKAFDDYHRGDLMYQLEEVKISNVDASASADLKAEEGINTVSSLRLELTRDTRDNSFVPTSGHLASGSIHMAGGPLGADRDFFKYFVSNTVFLTPFRAQQVLSLKLRAGVIHAYDDTEKVPIFERFFAGGTNTIRGYEEREVGPKDASSGDPIGGEGFLVGNVEYTFPIVAILKGAVFYDVGGVWSKTGDFGQKDYRSGAGVGIRIKTPLGPVSLDLGVPLNPDSTQKDTPRFHFNISRGF
ncbi:MAG: outer membrane protein assembly factor BamA [Candidatus Omnitrophota bacterium]